MLLRQRIVLVLCSFIVYGFVIMLEGSACGPITTIQQDSESTMEIALRIDKPDAAPGEKVTLKELVPVEMDAQVVSILHDILHIGRYDRKSGKMMNLKYSLFGKVNADNEFDKLPGCTRCSNAYIFDDKKDPN